MPFDRVPGLEIGGGECDRGGCVASDTEAADEVNISGDCGDWR
jgi:hypothetical protein